MTRVFAVVALLAAFAMGRDASKVVQSSRPFAAGEGLPVMDHGWVVFLDHNSPVVYAQRPDGTPAYTTTIQLPTGLVPTLWDAAVDSQGRAAVAIAYRGGETGAEGAVVLLDSSGKQIALNSTGRYLPEHLCFDSDGAIWTAGWQRDLVRMDTEDEQDYAVIRRFNNTGEQTGAFVNRSTFPRPGLSPGSGIRGQWAIRWSRDRIGAHLMSGQTSERMVWLELDRSGKELGRWTLPNEHTNGLAFADGELYSAISRNPAKGIWISHFVKLDRTTGRWQSIATRDARKGWGIVMDADGDSVILTDDNGESYKWLKP